MKIGIPDLISPSYFVAIAACELGMFAAEGIDMDWELVVPVDQLMPRLRDGDIDFVGGPAHFTPQAFAEWKGAKIVAAQSQGLYWFLVLRADIGARRGEIGAVRGLKIGAAPLVDLTLRQLLVEAGIDIVRDKVEIVGVPGVFLGDNLNFGVAAAKALEAGIIDGFWANGMGAEIAARSGAGSVVLDPRRGDGPPNARYFNQPSIVTTEAMIERKPDIVAGVVRAVVKTQDALKADVSLAAKVGAKLFPASEAKLIGELIRRDLPYYKATVSREFVSGMTAFQRNVGLIKGHPGYEDVVAAPFSTYW